MIKLRTAILLCLAAGGPIAPIVVAAPRVMLVESFTNYSCPDCPIADAVTNAFLAACGPVLVLGVQYHAAWPDADDPYYLDTAVDADGRSDYYSLFAVPAVRSDGEATPDSSPPALAAAAGMHLGAEAPFTIGVEQAIHGEKISVTATVTAVGAVPADNLVLRMALVETEIHLVEPIGGNGETDFYNTVRAMLPGHAGTALAISQGESQVFVQSATIDAAWNLANIRAVVWVQDDGTHEVLQAGSTAPRPTQAFFYGASETADVVALASLHSFGSLLTNYGTLADVYDIHIAPGLPAGWSGSVCVGATCYPPWITDVAVGLAGGARIAITVDVQPLEASGSGTMTLAATSRANPTQSWTRVFKVISDDVPVLLVDNDGGASRESWYTSALDASGQFFATWDHTANGAPTAAQLGKFPGVVWTANDNLPPLAAGDMAALAGFLDGGGRLLISDSRLGWTCTPPMPLATPDTYTWYTRYMGASFIGTALGDDSISGVGGDPIGDGLSFNLGGGTGAAVRFDSSLEIAPGAGAFACLMFDADLEAGIRHAHDPFRVVYLTYEFETQDSEESRNLVMDRSLAWLASPLVGVPGDRLPPLAVGPTAVPNPFNPATRIAFTVGGVVPVPVRVAIHDLRGRFVRILWDGPAAPGECTLTWDGRTGAGALAASGVYLLRVRVADVRRSLRLTLAR